MMKSNDDDALMESFRKGDACAFETLYERYRQPLFRYLFLMLDDRVMAEDVFQETFLKVFQFRGRYRPGEKFSHFLFKVAKNSAIDVLRKVKKTVPFESVTNEPALAGSEARSPEEEAILQEETRALHDAIRSLPPEQRQVLLLREYLDIPFKEIAHLTGCPLNTALGRMHYAIRRIREAFRKIPSSQGGRA
ncbi:MAG: sigma-70 family RNA polymerase sigma factor [Candidatus Eremiobacteraeota bacterium]|nr:sigma-70 family RNA polymerase sigma factor [Candidatus Eremiobacteraeota bacterium]